MSKDAAVPADPAAPTLEPEGRANGTEKVKNGSAPRRERKPLQDFAEVLGRTAAREALRGLCVATPREILFALALAYAVVMAILHLHISMVPPPR